MTATCHATTTSQLDAAGRDEPVVSLRMDDGSQVDRPLRILTAGQMAHAVPWRSARSVRGQTHFPGYYWAATTGTHVLYESRLELARLLLADFDPDVVGIVAQPFRLAAPVAGRVRRHVPDFFLAHADGAVTVVNVKPANAFADPEVAAAMEWPRRLMEAHGWGYEVWSGDDAVYLANVRFLAGYRRPGLVPPDLLEAVLAAAASPKAIAWLVARLGRGFPVLEVKAAVLRLLWQQRLITDLHRRLDGDSLVEVRP